jgi:hypothetical protein
VCSASAAALQWQLPCRTVLASCPPAGLYAATAHTSATCAAQSHVPARAGNFTRKDLETVKALFKNQIDFVMSDRLVQVRSRQVAWAALRLGPTASCADAAVDARAAVLRALHTGGHAARLAVGAGGSRPGPRAHPTACAAAAAAGQPEPRGRAHAPHDGRGVQRHVGPGSDRPASAATGPHLSLPPQWWALARCASWQPAACALHQMPPQPSGSAA